MRAVLTLIKYKISIAVTFTALTGYIVYSGAIDAGIIPLIISVFILAGGASALNECQESKFDAKMDRTKDRPIPAGRLSVQTAYIISTTFIIAGLGFLYFFFGLITASLGLFNIIWYNFIYTKLKRITAYAVIPGSLVGAIPVFMGWTAAGGYVFDRAAVFIAFFIFIWQIPHFWLLMLKYAKEYEAAGFPTVNQSFSPENLKRIILSWIVATSFISISIPLFLDNITWLFFILIFILNLIFVTTYVRMSIRDQELSLKKTFAGINIYMFIFMLLLLSYHLF